MERREAKDDSVKVTMTFRRPENDHELMQALNAPKYVAVLWDLDNWLRNEIKHGDDAEKGTHYQQVRDKLWSCLEDEGIGLE